MNIFQFMRAELCACEFHDRQASWMWIWWELSFAKLIFMIAELGIVNVNLWEMSITNVNFMRAENCKCEFYKNWAFIWILRVSLWERSIANVRFANMSVNFFLTAEHCGCNLWELSFANMNYGSCCNVFVVHILNGNCIEYVVRTANDSCDASVVNSEPIINK